MKENRDIRDVQLINQARGPYQENISPSPVQKRPRADILPVRPSHLVNKGFITELKLPKNLRVISRDPSGQYPVRYFENIGPAMEQSEWLILDIGPLN